MHVPTLIHPGLAIRETINVTALELAQIAVSADVSVLLISLSRLILQYGALDNPSQMLSHHASLQPVKVLVTFLNLEHKSPMTYPIHRFNTIV